MRHLVYLALVSGCTSASSSTDTASDTTSGVPTDDSLPTADSQVTDPAVPGCDDPTLRDALGPYERFTIEVEPAADNWIWGAGLLVGDYDDDGQADLWVTAESGIRGFEFRDGGLFEVPTGLPSDPTALAAHGGGVGGAVADIDGDGDLDVFVTRWEGSPRASHAEAGINRLYRNDGGVFVDVTEAAGVDGCVGAQCLRSTSASFGDIDADGDLDLFVGGYGFMPDAGQSPDEPAFLYLNDGTGVFTDVSDRLPPVAHRGSVLAGGFVDLDGDRALDLYIVNDIGTVRTPNVALRNVEKGARWVHEDEWGLSAALDGMGMGVGDVNGDGRPDFLIPGWGNAMYLQSIPGRTLWAESALATGLWIRAVDIKAGMDVGWGSALHDLDNDGDLDAMTQYGPFLGVPGGQPDAVWRNDGTPTAPVFVLDNAAFDAGDPGDHRGVAVLDLDRDGWLDVVKASLGGTLTVQRARCGANAWLGLELSQPGANRHGVGAVVEIRAGTQTWTRTVRAGGTSVGVALPPEVHVGLGSVERVDDVVVHWPDGGTTSLGPTDTRQWRLVER